MHNPALQHIVLRVSMLAEQLMQKDHHRKSQRLLRHLCYKAPMLDKVQSVQNQLTVVQGVCFHECIISCQQRACSGPWRPNIAVRWIG